MNDRKTSTVSVAKAKGRPMLQWVGKRPLERVIAYPAQPMESFNANKASLPLADIDWSDWPERFPKAGLLFHGDNKDCLAYLLANGFRGKVNLIYIDPPFDSGADYVRKVELRGKTGIRKIDGEDYSQGEQVQYADIWANDNYLQFIYERLQLLRELLREDGSIILHCDWHRNHQLRCLLDEVFCSENFRNEIVWAYPGREMHIENKFNAKHDTLLFSAKSDKTKVNMAAVAIAYDKEQRLKGLRRKIHTDSDGKEWVWETRGQAAGQEPYKRYIEDILADGRALNDVWDNVQFLRGNDPDRTGYPTQKPEELIERIVLALTNEGDIVFDCFIGSGTTAAVAQKMGRRWLACDINKGAIQTTAKRLQGIMSEQHAKLDGEKQQKLDTGEAGEPLPAQVGYCLYRVNDYDLQIQHNEAVELACEHIGITRTRSDAYFDGTFRGTLTKITPFNHPLTPLDLEGVKAELKNRPDEERDITVVCLGMELAAKAWVEQHNRNRPINKIHLIELRTDKKYGGVIRHEPMSAEVDIRRERVEDGTDRVIVEIRDVVSPSIVQRLNMDATLFRAKIADWRAMVDTVLIDTQYDGQVFNVALADVPPRKQDVVSGRYELPAPPSGSTVAVKIIDMLGEEFVHTATV